MTNEPGTAEIAKAAPQHPPAEAAGSTTATPTSADATAAPGAARAARATGATGAGSVAGDGSVAGGKSRAGVTGRPELAPGAGVLAVLALAWLAAMLWSAQAAISSARLAEMALTSTAYALPGAISASLVGGAGLALAVVDTLARRSPAGARAAAGRRRFAVAGAAGLATGLVSAGTVLLTYGDGRAVTVVAGTITAAGTIGGVVAGIRAARAVAAVIAGALAVFAIGFLLNLFQAPLLDLYGSGETQASQASALGWFAMTASVLSGLAAGLVSFGYLHRTRVRRAGATVRWPAYAAAGAGPGLLLLAAEVLARTGGAQVLALAGTVSEADRAAQSLLSGSRMNNALIVIFIGALAAILAVGRTLQPAAAPESTEAA